MLQTKRTSALDLGRPKSRLPLKIDEDPSPPKPSSGPLLQPSSSVKSELLAANESGDLVMRMENIEEQLQSQMRLLLSISDKIDRCSPF